MHTDRDGGAPTVVPSLSRRPGFHAGRGAHSGWEHEQVFDSATRHFESMLAGIRSARATIELAVYIFALDEVGEIFVEALREAAQRGVVVRVLVDGVGSARSAVALGELLSGVGAKFHVYHPLPWYWDNYRWSLRQGRWLEKFRYFINTVNRRDHRKFMIVDGQFAWCGNYNLSADHVGTSNPWRDYGAQVSGAAVATLLAIFDRVWFRGEEGGSQQSLRLADFQLCASNISLRMRWVRNRKLAQSIRAAKRRVWIGNAYFSPSPSVLRAIRAASRRGIDVRVIVAGRSDIPLFPLLTSTYYADLLKLGVQVYQYERGVLHAKVLLVDDKLIIGSTNLNHRSFYHDLELDVILSKPASIACMEAALAEDMSGSRRITPADVGPISRSFWFGWLPRLLRYWM